LRFARGVKGLSMKCDPNEFRHLVERFDLPVEEQDALIHTVWRIMESAVDRAWNADPVQMVMAGQSSKDASLDRPVIELEMYEYRELSGTFKDKNGEVHLTRIQELMDRTIYAGYIDYEPWGLSLIKGQHEPLISLETWQAVQGKRSERANAPARKDINADFPLRGFVCCNHCGKAYTACWSKGRKKHYPYYLCDTKGCPSHRKSIGREKVEGEFETILKAMVPSRDLFDLSLAIFQKICSHHEDRAALKQDALQAEIKQLEKQKEQLLDRLVATNNQSVIAAYENRIEAIDRKTTKITDQSRQAAQPNGTFKEIYRTAFSFLANPCSLWASDRLEDKRAVAKLVIADTLTYKRNQGYRTAKNL